MEQILLLEDDIALGQGIAMALQIPNIEIAVCRTLGEARRALAETAFVLLILDVNLPDGSGLDLLRALVENRGRAVSRAALVDRVWTDGGEYVDENALTVTVRRLRAKLKDDPRIAQSGLRRFIGMPAELPFNKSHVEIGYADAQYARWMFCDPAAGRLPREGTSEAATDTEVLRLLGVEPVLGAEFTVTFPVDGHETTQTFTLSGWWERDEAVIASHILIPESRVNEILREVGVTPPGSDGMTGTWNLDVMLKSGARRIRADLDAILRDHGCQSGDRTAEGYVDVGVNWAYTGAQLSERLDISTLLLLGGMLALILLTGCLIIYNVFQISVAEDIRLYGIMERDPDGLLAADAQLYGMEPFALERLTVLDGDLSKLSDPDGHYIAAVCSEDDYGNADPDSHWAKLGDAVRLRYVERWEFYDPATGEVFPDGTDLSVVNWQRRAAEYRDAVYTVAALVSVPIAFSYRYYGDDEFVLDAQVFCRDSGTDCVMYYAFDTAEDRAADMEAFLKDYTQTDAPELDYESRFTYTAEFDGVRAMFLLLGGMLSGIVGLVGALNFTNAVVTGVSARRRELAVLRSVGMTARQVRAMLVFEGLFYTLGAVALALVLTLAAAPAMRSVLESLFWFLTYRFTLWPVLAAAPVFAALGIAIPAPCSRREAKRSIVERLRQE